MLMMMDDDDIADGEDDGNDDDVDANATGWVPRDARRSQERQGGRRMVHSCKEFSAIRMKLE